MHDARPRTLFCAYLHLLFWLFGAVSLVFAMLCFLAVFRLSVVVVTRQQYELWNAVIVSNSRKGLSAVLSTAPFTFCSCVSFISAFINFVCVDNALTFAVRVLFSQQPCVRSFCSAASPGLALSENRFTYFFGTCHPLSCRPTHV